MLGIADNFTGMSIQAAQPILSSSYIQSIRHSPDFEEIFAVKNTDLVLVTQGFHSTAAAPGSNVYFLNYLAGELLDADRKTPSYDDPDYAWLKADYTRNLMRLPVIE